MTESRNEQPGDSAYPANESADSSRLVSSSGGVLVEPNASELVERLQAGLLGAFDLLSVFLGDQLGYYRSLLTASRSICVMLETQHSPDATTLQLP